MGSVIRNLIKWFKIRFIFTDEQLKSTLWFFDAVDPKRLKDDALFKNCQYNSFLIARELARRQIKFW